MKENAREYYVRVKAMYEYHVKNLIKIRDEIEKTADVKELVDWAYALNQSNKFIDEIRKNLNGLEELAEKICCVVYIQTGNSEPVRTPHCTGSPGVTLKASLPKRRGQHDEWVKLMVHLGVPKHLIDVEDQQALDFHWPGLMAYLTRLQMEGKPLPPGVDVNKTYPEYHVTLKGRRGVDEDIV